MIEFQSLTIRAFKLDLEDRGENYAQLATYLGTLPESPHGFLLDDKTYLRAGLPTPVSGNSALMLSETRYRSHFRIVGDRSVHYGAFSSSGMSAPPAAAPQTSALAASEVAIRRAPRRWNTARTRQSGDARSRIIPRIVARNLRHRHRRQTTRWRPNANGSLALWGPRGPRGRVGAPATCCVAAFLRRSLP